MGYNCYNEVPLQRLYRLSVRTLKSDANQSKERSERGNHQRLVFSPQSGYQKFNPDKESWGDWLTTHQGRQKVGQIFGFYGMVLVISGCYSFYIFFVDLVKEQYNDKETVTLRQQLEGTAPTETIDPKYLKLVAANQGRAGLSDHNLDRVDLFHCNLLDPVVIGFTTARQGAAIGIPGTMLVDKVNMEELRFKPSYNLFFKGYKLDDCAGTSEERKELEKLLVLSEPERNFVMSRQLAMANSLTPLYETIVPAVSWLGTYMLGFFLNNKFDLLTKPRYLRWALQLPVITGSFLLYIFIKNRQSWELETDAVRLVCQTYEHAEVAKGFYLKMIERNKSLRNILGASGADFYFQQDGELVSHFYEIQDYTSIHARVDFCENLKNSLGQPS